MGGWEHDHPPSDAKRLESANVARLFARVAQVAQGPIPPIDTHLLCELHGLAMDRVIASAGLLRTRDVEIIGSRHVPPPAADVPSQLVAAFAELSHQSGALQGAAYVMWRINWIHPFDDGNGRTARALALLVLFSRLGRAPIAYPDRPTVLDLLARYRLDYFDALESADRAWLTTHVADVSQMAALLRRVMRESLA